MTDSFADSAVIFIDAGVPAPDSLLRELPDGAEVAMLSSALDGLAQIAQYLAGRQGLKALHIVSHGEPGVLALGAGRLTAADLDDRSLDLMAIGNALAAGGSILLYGCRVAAGAEGAAFVHQMAHWTGAAVAASTTLTGSAELGGDWTLGYRTGPVAVPLSAPAYAGLLATYTVTSAADSGAGSLREALAAASSSDIVSFSSSLANTTITLGSSVTVPAGVTLNNTSANGLTIAGSSIILAGATTIQHGTLTISSNLAGSGSLNATGFNYLILSGTNTFSGGLTNSSGMVQVDGDANLGTGTLTLAGGSLVVASSSDVLIDNNVVASGGGVSIDGTATLSGTISGSGTLTKTGAGTLTLTGTSNNSSTFGLAVSGGTVAVAGQSNVGTGTITVGSGGTFQVTGGGTIANAFTVNGIVQTDAATTFSGLISGSSFDKRGIGTLTLSNTGNEAVLTGLSITGGAVSVSSDDALAGGTVTLQGGALEITGSTTIDNALVNSGSGTSVTVSGASVAATLSGQTTLSHSATFSVGSGAALTVSGVITDNTDTYGITKSGAGGLTLSGSNLYNGTTTVSAGTLTVASTGNLGSLSAVTVASGATLSSSAANLTLGSLAGAGSVSFGANSLWAGGDNSTTVFSGTLTGSGNFRKRGTGTLALSGTNSSSHTGTTQISAGTLTFSGDSNLGAGTITVESGATLTSGSVAALTVDNAITADGGTIKTSGGNLTLSGLVNGSDGLTKAGPGGLILTHTGAANSPGATTVSQGWLSLAAGVSSTGNVTVNSGTNLLSNGTVTGNVTVNSGGGLSAGPNTTTGSLAITGNLILNGTLYLDAASASDYDRVAVSGTVTLGSSSIIDLTDLGAIYTAGTVYRALDNQGSGAIAGTLNGLAEGATLTDSGQTYTVSYAGGTGDDLTVAVPAATSPPPPPPPASPPPPPVVDGVTLTQTTSTASNGGTLHTTTIPTVTEDRQEQVGNSDTADIPLVQDAGGYEVLTTEVPTGFGLSSTGSGEVRDASSSISDLLREIDAHTDAGSDDRFDLTDAGTAFLSGLSGSTNVVVQSIVPTVSGSTAPDAPLVISAPRPESGVKTAVVIDLRGLPSGTVIQLENIDFAAVVGAVRLTGGNGAQSVLGDGAAQYMVLGADDDTLRGGDGADTVGSEGGNDLLYGDEGGDFVFGGLENDSVFGGVGVDTVNGNVGDDFVQGNQGDDQVYGGKGNDVVRAGKDNDTAFGDIGNDRVYGDYDADLVFGGTGADTLIGGDGNDSMLDAADTLRGGQDHDLLLGERGDDQLWGDFGEDTLTGGAGADRFVFRSGDGADTITDFSFADGDRIALTDGQGWSVAAAGSNALVTLGGGGSVLLQNVAAGDVSAAWFVTA